MKAKNGKPQVHYDSQMDALYIVTGKGHEDEFVEMAPGIHVELDNNGQMIGIEILNASRLLKSVSKKLVAHG